MSWLWMAVVVPALWQKGCWNGADIHTAKGLWLLPQLSEDDGGGRHRETHTEIEKIIKLEARQREKEECGCQL